MASAGVLLAAPGEAASFARGKSRLKASQAGTPVLGCAGEIRTHEIFHGI